MPENMLILTGRRASGKSTLLQRVIEENDLNVQGFLSLKIFENGEATGIRLLTLPEREEIFMAVASPDKSRPLSTGHFAFEDDVFETIDALFTTLNPDLPFVMDEFGRLEMRGLAHFGLFQKVRASGIKFLVVVRKELIDQFLGRYGDGGDIEVLDVETKDNTELQRLIASYLKAGE